MKRLFAILQVGLMLVASFVILVGAINDVSAIENGEKIYVLNPKGDIFAEIPKNIINDPNLKQNWYMRLCWGNMTPVQNATVFVDVLAENGSSIIGNLTPVYVTNQQGSFPLPPEVWLPNARYFVIKKVIYDSLTLKPYPNSFYLPDEDNKPPIITFISPVINETNESIIRPGETLDIIIDVQENFLIETVDLWIQYQGSDIHVPIYHIGPNRYKASYAPDKEGVLYIKAIAYDYFGNKNETTIKVLVTKEGDSYPITILSYGPEGRYSNPRPLIFFNYSEDLGVKVMNVTINGIPIAELSEWRMFLYDYRKIQVNETIVVTIYIMALQPISDLNDGEYVFNVYLEDYGGNIANATWTYIVDTTGPSLTYFVENAIMPPWSQYYFTNGSISLRLMSSSSDCVMFKYTIDDSKWHVVEAPQGVAEVVIDLSGFSEGLHEVKIVAIDDLGNVGSISNFTVFYDSTGPEITIPFTHYRTKENTISIETTIEDNAYLASYEVYRGGELIAGETFIGPTSEVIKTIKEDLEEGVYEYKVLAKDIAGNTNEKTFIVEVDQTGPRVKIIEPKSGSLYGKNDMPIVLKASSYDADISYYEYSLDGGATWKMFEGETELNLPEGEYVLLVRGVDSLGNIGDPVQVRFKVDLTPPIIGDVSVEDSIVRVEVRDEFSGIANYEVKVDGTVIDASYDAIGYIEFEVSYGYHRVYIKVYDAAGNVAEKVFDVEISPPPTETPTETPTPTPTLTPYPPPWEGHVVSSGMEEAETSVAINDAVFVAIYVNNPATVYWEVYDINPVGGLDGVRYLYVSTLPQNTVGAIQFKVSGDLAETLGGKESVSLFYYDESSGTWKVIPTAYLGDDAQGNLYYKAIVQNEGLYAVASTGAKPTQFPSTAVIAIIVVATVAAVILAYYYTSKR